MLSTACSESTRTRRERLELCKRSNKHNTGFFVLDESFAQNLKYFLTICLSSGDLLDAYGILYVEYIAEREKGHEEDDYFLQR